MSILRAKERYDLLNGIQITLLIGRTLAIVFLMGDSLVALGTIFALSAVITGIAAWLTVRSVSPAGIEDSASGFDPNTFRTIRKFGLYSFLNSLADQFRFYTDSLVIGQFMKVQFITYYNLAAIFVTYFRHFIGHAASPFFPVFSRYHGTGDTQALRRTFLRASKTLSFLAVLAAGNLMGSAYPFLKLWVGQILAPEHVLLGYQVLLVLLLPFTVELTQSIAVNLIYGMGQHHRLTTLNGLEGLEGLANLILSIVLVQRFGLVGVALGTGIPLVVTQMGFVSRIVCRLIGLDVLRYILRSIVIPVLGGLALGVAQIVVYRSTGAETYWLLGTVAVSTSLASLAFAIPMLFLYFSRDERQNAPRNVGLVERTAPSVTLVSG